MNEIWIKIDLDIKYSVSNLGNIKNNITNRILKGNVGGFGHIRVQLSKRKRFLVHRLVAMAFIPNPKKYPIINHLNSNPSDNRVENLEWTTASGNAIHARDNNRLIIPTGSKNGMSVLEEKDVIKLIDLWNKGLTQREISEIMNVTRSCVAHITQGNRWKAFTHLITRK